MIPTAGGPPTDLVARLRAAGCVFAEEEAALLVDAASDDAAALEALVVRRVAGEPLEQVLGWAWFAGRRVVVEPGVFVPRRRSELLVREAVAALRAGVGPRGGVPVGALAPAGRAGADHRGSDRPVVVDLCCGSGALGAAVALAVPGTSLWSSDVDPRAVACARRNVPPGSTVLCGDLDAPLPGDLRGRVAVLLANVPYVPTDAVALMPPEARSHEPRHALDGGADGLELLRRVAALAPGWLAPGGVVLLETSVAQAPAAVAALAAHGLGAAVVHDDDLDATAVRGTRPPTRA